MNKGILIGIMGFFLLMPMVSAINQCDGANHLVMELNITKHENGDQTVFGFTERVYCPHGCENNITAFGAGCIEAPYIVTAEILIGIAVVFIFLFAVVKVKG